MQVTSVTDVKELIRYRRAGVSQRATAEALGLSRNTVANYERELVKRGWLEDSEPMPDERAINQMVRERFVPGGQVLSKLVPHQGWIESQLALNVSISKIHRELRKTFQVSCAYSAVWGYVQQLKGPEALDVTVRVETGPGEEAQVDFGYGGWMYDPLTRKLRKSWAFVMTLSYSRHAFVKFVFDQSTATWLRLHREGFEYFGGVPGRIKLDNLKAAIIRASVEDPQVQRAYRELAEHYGFLISPCRPRTPQHKGKVEAGVKYVKGDFLSGTDYTRADHHIGQANIDVREWTMKTAGLRIHGTTRWQPVVEFERVERTALRQLPELAYEVAVWTCAKLHRDGHIVLDGSYYSAPARYVGQYLDVRITDKAVQLYVEHERIATHTRLQARGQRLTEAVHLPEFKALGLATRPILREQAAQIGPYTAMIVGELLDSAPVDKHRVAQRLIGLASKHDKATLERACKRAFECGDTSSATVRNMITLITSGKVALIEPLAPVSLQPAMFARGIEELAPMEILDAFRTIEPQWMRDRMNAQIAQTLAGGRA